MSTRSFAAKPAALPQEATETTTTTATSTELVPREERPIVIKNHYQNAAIEGEIDSGDIRLPRFNLVQKSGKLNNLYPPGSLVFNKDIPLSIAGSPKPTDGAKPITITAMKLKKLYQQSLPFDPNGPTPEVFATSEEVREHGGHFCYDERRDGNYYRDLANIIVLLECPPKATEAQRDFFIYEHGGKDYALAAWTVVGGAYTIVARTLITAAMGHLREGLHLGAWSIGSQHQVNGELEWFAYTIQSAGMHTPEFAAFAQSLLN